eukprot:TRINITY_DN10755_c0_g1_i1.p1 TRINITY_DN10755_c0_g1~~TRINITY_DN10755_c0_g1_i1.p1  ORF type:complete len:726 (-),score=153.40 TRINITY_DN10755_c0_g1_i1:521-2635(-)
MVTHTEIEVPSSPAREQKVPQTPSTCPGTPLRCVATLTARVARLQEEAARAPRADIKLLWPGDSPLPGAPSACDDERLWEDILVKFGASKVPAAVDAQHFQDVIDAGMSWSAVPFPQMPLRAKAFVAPAPVVAPYQDVVPFPILQEPVQECGCEAEREALESLLAGRAGEPLDLRKAFYNKKELDMALTLWPLLPDAVILADECTAAQRSVWELRARRPILLPQQIEKRRAALAERLQGKCNYHVFQEIRPTLAKNAAVAEWKARLSRDAATAARQFDQLAEQGAALVAWVVPNERRWPEQSKEWTKFAQWFKMWRMRAPLPQFQPLRRNGSSSSLDSWDMLSEVSWEDMQSKASECGWQEVLDEQMQVVVEADARHICKADIVELKALAKPPAGVGLVMEVVCIILQVPPVQLRSGRVDYWQASKKLLSDVTFLERLLTLDMQLPAKVVNALGSYMSREDFTPERLKACSMACVGLCRWARELYKYNVLQRASASAQAPQKPVCKAAAALRSAPSKVARQGCSKSSKSLDEPSRGLAEPQDVDRTLASELLALSELAKNHLTKSDLQELKSLGKPPAEVVLVACCIVHLFAGVAPGLEGMDQNDWKTFQKLAANPTKMINYLSSFKELIDMGKIPRENIEKVRKIQMSMPEDLDESSMRCRSAAAAGLCAWLRHMLAYYDLAQPAKLCHEGEPESPASPALTA